MKKILFALLLVSNAALAAPTCQDMKQMAFNAAKLRDRGMFIDTAQAQNARLWHDKESQDTAKRITEAAYRHGEASPVLLGDLMYYACEQQQPDSN